MKCDKCNKEVQEDSSFCNYCGEKIDTTDRLDKTIKEILETTKEMVFIFSCRNLFLEENPKIMKQYLEFLKKPKIRKKIKKLQQKLEIT